MKFYVRCDGCRVEGNPKGVDGPPEYWQEIDMHLLCSECLKGAREVLTSYLASRKP